MIQEKILRIDVKISRFQDVKMSRFQDEDLMVRGIPADCSAFHA